MVEDKSVFSFRISNVIKFISITVLLLVLASVAANVYYYTFNDLAYIASLFNLDKEGNIPTRLASGLLVMASFLFYIIYRIQKKEKGKYILHWLFLAIVFLLMGLDESVQLHEQTSQVVKMYVKGLHFAWVIPGAIFVLVFGIAYLKFFLDLEPRWKKLFLVSAVLFVSGALGMELVGNFFQAAAGQDNLSYFFITNFEEVLEFSGVILLLYTQMSFIENKNKCYRVEIHK
jgi:hypothetical protein